MTNQEIVSTRSKASAVILGLSIVVFIFWLTSKKIDVYQLPWVGAIFELLWPPAIAGLLVLPLLSIFYWRKEHFRFNSVYLLALLILLGTIALTVFDVEELGEQHHKPVHLKTNTSKQLPWKNKLWS